MDVDPFTFNAEAFAMRAAAEREHLRSRVVEPEQGWTLPSAAPRCSCCSAELTVAERTVCRQCRLQARVR